MRVNTLIEARGGGMPVGVRSGLSCMNVTPSKAVIDPLRTVRGLKAGVRGSANFATRNSVRGQSYTGKASGAVSTAP